MFANSFLPLIDRPMRITGSRAALIDNVLYNNISPINQLCGVIYANVSDHMPIFVLNECYDDTDISYGHVYDTRVYNDGNIDTFIGYISEQDWHDVYNSNTAQEAYTLFSNLITNT